jgi:hypothetical protein
MADLSPALRSLRELFGLRDAPDKLPLDTPPPEPEDVPDIEPPPRPQIDPTGTEDPPVREPNRQRPKRADDRARDTSKR